VTSYSDITTFASEIAKRYSPERIVLFGSHAAHTAREFSDVDLLVVMNYDGSSAEVATDIRMNIPFGHPLDLLVRKPNDVRSRLEQHDFFLKEIFDTGVVLYEATH
jgi:predicted nucleotidyltransferase